MLFDRLRYKKQEIDESPELKRGEFKKILLSLMSTSFPVFEFIDYKNQCYAFRRTLKINQHEVIEGINFTFSLKEKLCNCSVESRLDHRYVGRSAYNTGLINPHIDLITLKLDKGVLSFQEAHYHHTGRVKSTTDMTQKIISDLEIYGQRFFKNQQENLKSNELLKSGLKILMTLGQLPSTVKLEIQDELKVKEYMISRIRHPLYLEIKENLQGIEGLTRELRREIPRLAYELLELK